MCFLGQVRAVLQVGDGVNKHPKLATAGILAQLKREEGKRWKDEGNKLKVERRVSQKRNIMK